MSPANSFRISAVLFSLFGAGLGLASCDTELIRSCTLLTSADVIHIQDESRIPSRAAVRVDGQWIGGECGSGFENFRPDAPKFADVYVAHSDFSNGVEQVTLPVDIIDCSTSSAVFSSTVTFVGTKSYPNSKECASDWAFRGTVCISGSCQ